MYVEVLGKIQEIVEVFDLHQKIKLSDLKKTRILGIIEPISMKRIVQCFGYSMLVF